MCFGKGGIRRCFGRFRLFQRRIQVLCPGTGSGPCGIQFVLRLLGVRLCRIIGFQGIRLSLLRLRKCCLRILQVILFLGDIRVNTAALVRLGIQGGNLVIDIRHGGIGKGFGILCALQGLFRVFLVLFRGIVSSLGFFRRGFCCGIILFRCFHRSLLRCQLGILAAVRLFRIRHFLLCVGNCLLCSIKGSVRVRLGGIRFIQCLLRLCQLLLGMGNGLVLRMGHVDGVVICLLRIRKACGCLLIGGFLCIPV